MQLAAVLMAKAMAAFASMKPEDAGRYAGVKWGILQRYEVNQETHCLQFRKDCHGAEETYQHGSHHLQEHFARWRKDRDIPLEEVVLIEQFMTWYPKTLECGYERKPKSLQGAAEQVYDYVASCLKG